MIMDKKGRLFGKINIIDLIVLIVLIAAVAFVGMRMVSPKTVGQDTIEMKFYIEEVDDWVADKIQIGDTLYDGTYEQEIGKVVSLERDTPRTWATTQDGQYVLSPREGYSSLVVTGEMVGTKTATGAEIGGKRYGVGHSMVLHAGDAKMYLRVYDIQVKE